MERSRFAGRRGVSRAHPWGPPPTMYTWLPCPALAGLAPVGAAPWDPEGDGDPRNGENWPQLGEVPASAEAGAQGPLCVQCVCVTNSQEPTPSFATRIPHPLPPWQAVHRISMPSP